MNRVGEYIRFAVWFTGLGYIALWPLTAHVDVALNLSPGLHLAGMASSGCVLICLVLRPLRRRKRARADAAAALTPQAIVQSRIGKGSATPAPPRRYVRPRSHFGLRGAPR
jgi:hypothetical protein